MCQPLAAVAICIISYSAATRPAQQIDSLFRHGESTLVAGTYTAERPFPDWQLLPKTCGGDGVINLQEGVVYRTEAGNHSIPESCHMLKGARGTRILLFGSIFFTSAEPVSIRGPLQVTLAPGIQNLSLPAVRSAGDLRAVSPKDSRLEFRDIATSTYGAALSSERNILLEGEGSITFENLQSSLGPAASSQYFDVNSTVANLEIRNCSGKSGPGAIFAGGQVHLESHGTVLFKGCTCVSRGAAIATVGKLKLTGRAEYVFEDCRSTSIDVGASGGALSSVEDVVIELHATGSVYFKDCVAEDSGGAIYSGRNIEISARSGSVQFERCHAGSGNGHAMIAHSGDLHISALTRVVLAGMDSNVGSAVFVRSATLPVGSGILPADVFALESLLASKTLSQGDDECPVGSRFSWDASGAPIPGRCPMCGSGTASLVTSSVVIDRKIAAPEVGMRVVLVRRNSPNNIFRLSWLTASPSESQEDGCNDPELCLALERGKWDRVWDVFPMILGQHRRLSFVFDKGMLRTSDGWLLVVPYNSYMPDTPLALIHSTETVSWSKSNETGMFVEDQSGSISPVKAPGLVFGVDHDVTYTFQPHNPYLACLPCQDMARVNADKIQCEGGTSVRSLPGYMVLHAAGAPELNVHQCPNRAACPGSNFSLTADGLLSPRTRLCAEGYRPSPGCVRCAPKHGRPQLDPFTCRPCGSFSLAQQVGWTVLSSSAFYTVALLSAKPCTDTQQIFKVFLAFVTISCRSLAAFLNTQQYQRLKEDLYVSANAIYRVLFAVDLVTTIEPGSSMDSYDCWGLVEGPVDVLWSLFLAWAIPFVLLVVSWCWSGVQGGLKALVVWGNLFVPVFAGAATKLIACFSTQEGQGRVLMYDAALGTPCASSMAELARLSRFWLALGTGVILFLLGPVLWLWLAARDPEKDETVAFLVVGYRPTLRWWEVIVLVRKTAIFVVAAMFPMSWAPGAHVIYLLGITIVAQLLHVTIQPYANDFLNRLEAQTLGISSACLVLVISLLVEWPFRPYAIYVASSALLAVLTAGAYIYFLLVYLRAVLTKQPLADEVKQAEEEHGYGTATACERG